MIGALIKKYYRLLISVMLVSAFAGRENVLNAYREAIREKYRFFSFGDACFFY